MKAEYWIARHTDNLLRGEEKNIGVFVKVGDRLAARFYAETEEGQTDRRKLREFAYPDVYQQWVDYWRRNVAAGGIEEVVAARGSHYRVVVGGEVLDIGGDSAEAVAEYLFALLVGGGIAEALNRSEEASAARPGSFSREIQEALVRLGVLEDGEKLFVPHPVQRGLAIVGRSEARYEPTFAQWNGGLHVMEPVDFTSRFRDRVRDHAGYTAYMFSDIRNGTHGVTATSLVRVTDDDLTHPSVDTGMKLLRQEGEIVYWFDESARAAFLETVKEAALME